MKIDIKFPCGYEFHASTEGSFWEETEIKMNKLPNECPIHGKDCP